MKVLHYSISLRYILILSILLAVIPAFVVTNSVADAYREAIREITHTKISDQLNIFATKYELLAKSTHDVLHDIAHNHQPEIMDAVACASLLKSLPNNNQLYINFLVLEPNGDQRCSALPFPVGILSPNQPWFVELQQTKELVGGVIPGSTTDQPLQFFAYPMLDEAGRMQAVILAVLSPTRIDELLISTELPEKAMLTVIDKNGTVFIHSSEDNRWDGRAIPDLERLKPHFVQAESGIMNYQGEDGVTHLAAYKKVYGEQTVLLTVPQGQIFTSVDRALQNDLIAIGLIGFLTLCASYFLSDRYITRKIKLLISDVQRIAQGDLSVRSGNHYGISELSQLAQAFNSMAESIEKRDRERAEIEQNLLMNEARLKEAQALAQMGNWELDLVSGDLYWSEEIYKIFEIDPQRFAASYEAFLECVHPDDRAKVDLAYRRSVEERTPYHVEHRLLFPDGRVKYVLEQGKTFYDPEGKPIRSIGTVQDITERVKVDQQIRLQVAALETAGDAIVITDRAGTIQWVNPAFTALTGYPAEEAIGQNMRLIKSGTQSQEYYREMWEAILNGNIWRSEIVNRRKDGALYECEMVVTPTKDATGSITHFVTIQRDISERKRRERELEATALLVQALTEGMDFSSILERLLSAAIYAVSSAERGQIFLLDHEGRPYLASIKGYDETQLQDATLLSEAGFVEDCVRLSQPLLFEDLHRDLGIRPDADLELIPSTSSAILVPLQARKRVIGVIALENTSNKSAFTLQDIQVLGNFAATAALVIENARLFDETRERLRQVSTLRSIEQTITSSLDPRVTMWLLLDEIIAHFAADAAAVLLLNPITLELEFQAGHGFTSSTTHRARLRIGECLAGRAALERRVLSNADLPGGKDYFCSQQSEEFAAYYAAPMIAKGKILGVLETFHREPVVNDESWKEFLEVLAGQAAIAIDNARLFEELERSNLNLRQAYDATIEGWARALDLRDKETEGHSRRVTELTVEIARALQMKEEELLFVRWGALLHDIGKMGIPDHILLKPGPLTPEEWEVLRKHPSYAYEMLEPIEYLRPALDIPYCHHEKWDGTGYPRGLKGKEIPLAARIFAVVDVFDALTSHRPYRDAWSVREALEYIQQQSGKHFDPEIVKVFLNFMTLKIGNEKERVEFITN